MAASAQKTDMIKLIDQSPLIHRLERGIIEFARTAGDGEEGRLFVLLERTTKISESRSTVWLPESGESIGIPLSTRKLATVAAKRPV